MNSSETELMRFRAAVDQMRELSKDIASMTKGYFDALKATGLSSEDAWELTLEWHSLYWRRLFSAPSVGTQ